MNNQIDPKNAPASLLTKREYFAAMALMGYVSRKHHGNTMDDDIVFAVMYSDGLIAELAKDNTPDRWAVVDMIATFSNEKEALEDLARLKGKYQNNHLSVVKVADYEPE